MNFEIGSMLNRTFYMRLLNGFRMTSTAVPIAYGRASAVCECGATAEIMTFSRAFFPCQTEENSITGSKRNIIIK